MALLYPLPLVAVLSLAVNMDADSEPRPKEAVFFEFFRTLLVMSRGANNRPLF